MLNDLFTGHLSKFNAVLVDGDVYVEFCITHISKNELDQNFLDNFSEELGNNVNRCLNDPQWDNIKFTQIIPNLKIKFDVMDLVGTLQSIRITQKETSSDVSFKYDLVFLKKQESEKDTHFATYLKHKDEDEDGKKFLTEYDVEITL